MVSLQALGLAFIVNLIVYTIVLHIAAILAKVEDATIMKALTVAVITAILALIFGLVTVYGGFIALIIAIALIKYFYGVTWSKAVIVWIIFLVLAIIIGVILGLVGLAVLMAA